MSTDSGIKERVKMSTTQAPAINMNKLNASIGQFVTYLGAVVHTGMVVIGEKLGLYEALADGPMSSAQLAGKTQTDERYLRAWLASQAAGGYTTYDDRTNKSSLSEEQALALSVIGGQVNEIALTGLGGFDPSGSAPELPTQRRVERLSATRVSPEYGRRSLK
jgi:hypothetical protein